MNAIIQSQSHLLILILLIYSVFTLQTKTTKILNSPKSSGLSSLTISNPYSTKSFLTFKLKNTELLYALGLIDNDFSLLSNNSEIINIQQANKTIIKSNTLLTNTLNLEGPLKYNGVSQWRMISFDNFQNNMTSLNWNLSKTSDCKKNHNMLGGFCQLSTNSLVKRFNNLPKHKMIRVEALYHFIGNWDHHTGYMKARINEEDKYLWSSRCKNNLNNKFNADICEYTVCKMGEVINVSFYHNADTLKLIFGSTLTGHPCDQSYGVSDIKIYIK